MLGVEATQAQPYPRLGGEIGLGLALEETRQGAGLPRYFRHNSQVDLSLLQATLHHGALPGWELSLSSVREELAEGGLGSAEYGDVNAVQQMRLKFITPPTEPWVFGGHLGYRFESLQRRSAPELGVFIGYRPSERLFLELLAGRELEIERDWGHVNLFRLEPRVSWDLLDRSELSLALEYEQSVLNPDESLNEQLRLWLIKPSYQRPLGRAMLRVWAELGRFDAKLQANDRPLWAERRSLFGLSLYYPLTAQLGLNSALSHQVSDLQDRSSWDQARFDGGRSLLHLDLSYQF